MPMPVIFFRITKGSGNSTLCSSSMRASRNTLDNTTVLRQLQKVVRSAQTSAAAADYYGIKF